MSGYVRMRIQSVYSFTTFSPLSDLSCGFITAGSDAGEYEDYTVYLGNPYQYSLNGGGFQIANNFSGLPPGSFTIDVQDNYGCVESVSSSITEPGNLISSLDVTGNETCETFNDGFAEGFANGGTGISGSNPYLFQLDGPTSFVAQTSAVFTGLSPGAYEMIVIDANDCRDTSAFTIAIGNSAPSPFSTNLDTAYYLSLIHI